MRHGRALAATLPPPAGRALAGLGARAGAAARAGSRRPGRALALLVAFDAAAAATFVALGGAAGDRALLFRELMPGTWISVAQLAFVAYVARELHAALAPPSARWHATFWGIASVVFAVLAADELLGTTQIVGTALNQGVGLTPAAGFTDVGAVLLTLLLAGGGLALAPRAAALLAHPRVLATLVAAVALGVASQALDSFVRATEWEFAAEESLKLGSGALLVGALLVARRDVLR